MSITAGYGKALKADMNVTPMIDILLVLIIIFMVITPVTSRGLQAVVPQDPQSDPDRVEYTSKHASRTCLWDLAPIPNE
jgi:biopolymer transport protein ExbD